MKCIKLNRKNVLLTNDENGIQGHVIRRQCPILSVIVKDNNGDIIDEITDIPNDNDTYTSTYLTVTGKGVYSLDVNQLLLDTPSLFCTDIELCFFVGDSNPVITKITTPLIPTELYTLTESYSETNDDITIQMDWWDSLGPYNAPLGTFQVIHRTTSKTTGEVYDSNLIEINGITWNSPTIVENYEGEFTHNNYDQYVTGIYGSNAVFDKSLWITDEEIQNMDCCDPVDKEYLVDMTLLYCGNPVKSFQFCVKPHLTILWPNAVFNGTDTVDYLFNATGNSISTETDGGSITVYTKDGGIQLGEEIPALVAPNTSGSISVIDSILDTSVEIIFTTSDITELEEDYTLSVIKNLPYVDDSLFNVLDHIISLNEVDSNGDATGVITFSPVNPITSATDYVIAAFHNGELLLHNQITNTSLVDSFAFTIEDITVGQHNFTVEVIDTTNGERYVSTYGFVVACY